MQTLRFPTAKRTVNATLEATREAVVKTLASGTPPVAVSWSEDKSQGSSKFTSAVPPFGTAQVTLTFSVQPSTDTYRRGLRRHNATTVTFSGTMECADTVLLLGAIPIQRQVTEMAEQTVEQVAQRALGVGLE